MLIYIVIRTYEYSGHGLETHRAFINEEDAEKYKEEMSKKIVDSDAYYEDWEIHCCELDL